MMQIPDLSEHRVLRNVKVAANHRLLTWDTGKRASTGQHKIGYAFFVSLQDEKPLFLGEDCGVSPMHCIDSADALLGLLSFLTLKPGDTDAEYFDSYTPDQLDWCKSSEAEDLCLCLYDAESGDADKEALFEEIDAQGGLEAG